MSSSFSSRSPTATPNVTQAGSCGSTQWHRLAVSGQSYRNQADALAALERATSGRVVRFATHAPGAPPAMLVMPGEYNVEIRRRRRRVPTVAPAHTMDQR